MTLEVLSSLPVLASTPITILISLCSIGAATTSTEGYTTANKLTLLASIDSQYQTYGQQYDRAYVAALTNSDLTDTEKATNTADIISAKKSLTTWRTSERESVING